MKLPRTTFSPIPELQQNSPPKLEMVTVNNDGADMSMSRHLSPNLPKHSAVRNEHRGHPTAPAMTPPTEDSVTLLRRSASISEEDCTPVHEDGKPIVNEHRGHPTATAMTPPTEDSVTLLNNKNSSVSKSEDDWTPVHEDGKRVVR